MSQYSAVYTQHSEEVEEVMDGFKRRRCFVGVNSLRDTRLAIAERSSTCCSADADRGSTLQPSSKRRTVFVPISSMMALMSALVSK